MRGRGASGRVGYVRIVRQLARACESAVDELFAPAEEADLESLAQLGLPDSVLGFYRQFAPADTLEVRSVRLWAIPHLLDENHTYSPGAEVHELGYVVVAANRHGDVFCLDLGEWRDEETPRVVRLPHDVEIGARDRNLVEKQAEAVADSFDEFLLLLASGEVPG